MDKKILAHAIKAASYDELSVQSQHWLNRMRGKIEVLDMERKDFDLRIIYYILDSRRVEFTIDELQCINEWVHDAVKDFPRNKLYRSIERKTSRALE